MSELLLKIAETGTATSPDIEKADIEILPEYRGNSGFFHMKGKNFELLFVKGVYKDNVRLLSGESPYEAKLLGILAQCAADTERTLRQTVTLRVFFEEEKVCVASAEPYQCAPWKNDRRDPLIPSPLTPVERSLGKGDYISDRHLFTKGPFAEVLPETLSPLTMSIAAGMPDVFNPLFMSCSIKTVSPSIKLLFGRLFMNMANTETIAPAFYEQHDFFLINYAQNLFNKIKKPSFGIPNDADLKITDEEITESIRDIAESIAGLSPEHVYGGELSELTALCVMTWEMVYIRLWKSFTSLHKALGRGLDDTLRHVYMTRSDSILNNGYSGLCTLFDPACPPSEVNPCGLKHLSAEEMHKTLPAAKRISLGKAKYAEKLEAAHRYLHTRDELYLAISALTGKVRELLMKTGGDLVSNSMIKEPSDIFYFEVKEIRNIMQDEFYGNIPFTIGFRKWQNTRFAALCLPYNIYERDVERVTELSKAQLDKSEAERTIPCLSIHHRPAATANFAAAHSFGLSDVSSLEGSEAVIAESASLFSFVTEYCSVKNIPLYTGARFAKLLLDGKKIITSENSISFE